MNGLTRRAGLGAAISITAGALTGCGSSQSEQPTVRITVGSDTMDPTLVKGKAATFHAMAPGAYRPHRQDIVLFSPPAAWIGFAANELLISRVIGIAGDEVSCAGKGSPVVLNGTALKEPYLYQGDAPSDIGFSFYVPPGRLWLLDDHRSIALDARAQLSDPNGGAYVPTGNVLGVYYR